MMTVGTRQYSFSAATIAAAGERANFLAGWAGELERAGGVGDAGAVVGKLPGAGRDVEQPAAWAEEHIALAAPLPT